MIGLDEIWIEAATKSFANLVVKTAGKLADKEIGRPLEQRLFNASGEYFKRYQERHGKLKVLGMSKPISLESVYTTVQLLDAEDIRSFESVEALESVYREGGNRRLGHLRGKKAGIDVANQEKYLTVLGGPGVGKSTFLRKMGLEALKSDRRGFRHECIPVFLELKRFDSADLNIKHRVIEEFKVCGFPDPEGFTHQALKKGRLLILLDGLDEVPNHNLTKVIQKIKDFVDQYDQNRFITSCRTAAYQSYFKRFVDVAIAEFNYEQIKQFISNWFQSDLDQQAGTAECFWQLLQQPNNASTLELAQTPLLLTYLCMVYHHSQQLPGNRSDLYQKALNILLEEWAAEKRIQPSSIYDGLYPSFEKALLSKMAYEKFKEDQLFFSKTGLITLIEKFLKNTLNVPSHLDGKIILNAIEIQQGLLVERAEGVYSFSHLTIQEFLTARYLVNHPRQLKKLIASYLVNSRWREVFLLVAGLQDSADDLLLDIERRMQADIRMPKLKKLLLGVQQMADHISEEYKPAVKRALFIFYFLDRGRVHAEVQASSYAQAYSHATTYARDLDVELTRTYSTTHALNLTHSRARARVCAHALALDLLLALGVNEWEALTNYLAASLVLLQCKQAAIGVSRDVWEGIESRILTVPSEPPDS